MLPVAIALAEMINIPEHELGKREWKRNTQIFENKVKVYGVVKIAIELWYFPPKFEELVTF